MKTVDKVAMASLLWLFYAFLAISVLLLAAFAFNALGAALEWWSTGQVMP
jgi:hypothetical protein